jgi:hypothetical protein
MPLPLLSFLLMLGAVVSISVLSNFYLFDRYLLISVVLAGFLYQETKPRSRGVLALQWMFIAALGAYSIAGTVDYWNWTGACFRLIDKLLVRGADPAEIDGGYCYHGLKTPVKIAADGKVDPNWETYWTIRRRTYVVEFFPGGRFDREVDRRPFFTPLYRREDSVLYLHQLDFGP